MMMIVGADLRVCPVRMVDHIHMPGWNRVPSAVEAGEHAGSPLQNRIVYKDSAGAWERWSQMVP